MPSLEKRWFKPTMVVFSTNEPAYNPTDGSWDFIDADEYIYLTDDGRAEMSVSSVRIETRERMINGTMRTWHVADKKTFSTSWTNIPSRARDEDGGPIISETYGNAGTHWAAGSELLDWYDSHTGGFWALMIYDRENNYDSIYSYDLVNVTFLEMSHSVQKRGKTSDLWNMSMSLEEV